MKAIGGLPGFDHSVPPKIGSSNVDDLTIYELIVAPCQSFVTDIRATDFSHAESMVRPSPPCFSHTRLLALITR
jgi:hypothetical protein